jgi:hypothetical protein
VIAGLLFWFWRRRQGRKAAAAGIKADKEPKTEVAKPELGGNTLVEISGRGLVPKNELGGDMVLELHGPEDLQRRAELEAREKRV